MGLAASQAKLLSITSRLSDNELRSQSITAAKMGLAHETAEASRKYINALNQNEFIYRTYDQNGDKCYVPCTGMQLSTYGPLKNQYCLVNTKGQVMVSELDGANYQDSKDINEFLAHYGIDAIPTGEYKQVRNPEYSDAYGDWKRAHDEWLNNEPPEYIETLVSEAWTEEIAPAKHERIDTTGWWDRILHTGCIDYTVGSHVNCWMHVVSSLVGEGDHKTSDGQVYHVYGPGRTCEHGHIWCWNTDQHPVDESLRNDLKNEHACGHNTDEYVDMPYNGGTITVRCIDDHCDEGKNVYQKLVDLLWEYHNDYAVGNSTGGPYTEEHVARFWHIINFDLCKWEEIDIPAEVIEHPAEYEYEKNPAFDEWVKAEPIFEEIPEYVDEEILEYEDKDKAQWYVNLWHRMNGPSQQKDGTMSYSDSTNVTTTEYGTEFVGTSTTVTSTFEGNRWYVLEDGLMNSQDWLKYALETGAVSLERVNFTNPTATGTGLKDATWTSIIYTNALDISEQQNEKAITIAEAEYEQKSREIENKDKQYDSMLKLLDTEHSALLQELETAKTVITKNTERTLKMYSA